MKCAMGTNNNFGSFIVVIISSSYSSVPFSQSSHFLSYNILSFRPVFETYFVKHALSKLAIIKKKHKNNIYVSQEQWISYSLIHIILHSSMYTVKCKHEWVNMVKKNQLVCEQILVLMLVRFVFSEEELYFI